MKVIETMSFYGISLDVYGTVEKPLFLAGDVAKMIDYSDGNTSHMLDMVTECEKTRLSVRNDGTSARGNATLKWFLTEEGLYEVFMQSRKPIAQKFKSVIKRMLKDLRHKGGYSIGQWFGRFESVEDLDGFNVLREDFGLPPVTDEEAFGRSFELEREYMQKEENK